MFLFTLNSINETLLMGPGPSSVSPQVYSSIAKSTIGHLDPKFIEIMDAIKNQLQILMGTKNELTIPFPSHTLINAVSTSKLSDSSLSN